ncbi:AraC family transcriptional regulator [Belliella sp. DSM 111904]|uniref:AraC family transcriptional regulator n=1 Tax=Belliella filtrata TaxID=2923435 RepID=A0ABS9V4Q5_9BACT|nr:AraC family transcriptional regulator [Belliella filtrata]MCH7411180.1 AraC family transcriptional regulator [Belliella filtrata]
MKPLLYQIPKSINEPVRVLKECHPYFYDNLHFHSEYQIMTILQGKGTYFIGDSFGNFNAGDSFILGANLPHFFRSSQEYYSSANQLQSQNISILYSPEALGEKFKDLSELHPINKLLEKSKNGLLVTGRAKEKLLKSSQKITHKNGFERLIYLFKMFDYLAKTDDLITLSHVAYENEMKLGDTEKINKVIDFLIDNYSKDITLADAADIANLSVNAFCRYFKKHTRKTFSQFLNEIRIGNACRQLVEEDVSVKEAAFKSGYYNISYFNRQFKTITGCTPSAYCKNINFKHLT